MHLLNFLIVLFFFKSRNRIKLDWKLITMGIGVWNEKSNSQYLEINKSNKISAALGWIIVGHNTSVGFIPNRTFNQSMNSHEESQKSK